MEDMSEDPNENKHIKENGMNFIAKNNDQWEKFECLICNKVFGKIS